MFQNYLAFQRMKTFPILCVISTILLIGCTCTSAAPTTSLSVSLIENNITIQNQNLDYTWMEENLPVIGDGIMHYYHQGPVFQGDPWDPNETVNLRDMGAIKGTSVFDICNISGGIAEGDEVMIKAVDGYYILYDARTIISPHILSGPLVIAWYNGKESGAGERQGFGYVPDYYTGMRLIFCAPENPQTNKHVFGNSDMKEALPERAQYFYSGLYPSTGGLSAKWVDEVRIYRGRYHGDRTTLLEPSNQQITDSASEPTNTSLSSPAQTPEPVQTHTSAGMSAIWVLIGSLGAFNIVRRYSR